MPSNELLSKGRIDYCNAGLDAVSKAFEKHFPTTRSLWNNHRRQIPKSNKREQISR